MAETRSFEVFLTAEATDHVGADPLVAASLDFHDAGVWVVHASGRDFFPYERIVRISDLREGSADDDGADPSVADGEDGAPVDADPSGADVVERRDPASGTTESVDGSDGD